MRNELAPRLMIAAALISSAVLLVSNALGISDHAHAYVSALPLALAGVAYALLQIVLRPEWSVLWKRLLLAATFVGWAVDQMLPPGPVATLLGDFVIAAFVLDLFWMVKEQADAGRS